VTSVREDPAEAARNANRAIRAANYEAKHSRGFACAECGTTERVLAVDVKGTDEVSTRCEGKCLDRRKHTVRPLQFDERERLEKRST